MNVQKTLSIVGAGAVAFWFSKAIINNALDKIDFQGGQATIDTTLLPVGKIRINWQVSITNNNTVSVNVDQIAGQVYYGSVSLGNVYIANPLHLVPGQMQHTTLVLEVPADTIINDMFASIQQNGVFSALVNAIRFDGVIYTSLINIPVNTNIPIV